MSTHTVHLHIGGMHCASCVSRVEQALAGVTGVQAAHVSLVDGSAAVEFTGSASLGRLCAAVAAAGYRAEPQIDDDLAAQADDNRQRDRRESARWRQRLLLAVLLTAALLLLETLAPAPWLLALLASAIQLGVGAPYYRGAWQSVRRGVADMDTLIALGTSVAFAASLVALATATHAHYLHEAPLLLTVVTLGKWLETRGRWQTGAAMRALLMLTPPRARVVRGASVVEIAAAALVPGDVVLIRPGDSVPADGTIREGFSALNEALLTGESVPVEKQVGDAVYAGSVNQHGLLRVEVRAVGAATRLGQIIALVHDAQITKAPIQRLADRVSARFVPVVLLLAALTLLGHGLLSSWASGVAAMVAVLVVACPCALGLATPTAIVVGMGRAAQSGILFRSAEVLEKTAALRTIFFDKTGTLTLGQPAVVEVWPAPGVTRSELLRAAALAEAESEHPLARAVRALADDEKIAAAPATSVTAVPGGGVRAVGDGQTVRVGTLRFVQAEGVHCGAAAAFQPRQPAATLLWVAREAQLLGALALLDRVRPEAAAVLAHLRAAGLRVAMLTGDRRATALAIASEIGLRADEVHAEMSPAEKVAAVRQASAGGALTAMVGDGINDAPALAATDVGLALGSGTEIAKAAGQVLLVGAGLEQVPRAHSLALATLRTIRQNLIWAFAYNLVLLPLASVGMLPHLWAAVAMALSSVSVVANSLLLRQRV